MEVQQEALMAFLITGLPHRPPKLTIRILRSWRYFAALCARKDMAAPLRNIVGFRILPATQANDVRSYNYIFFKSYANVQRKRDIFTANIYYYITPEFDYSKT